MTDLSFAAARARFRSGKQSPREFLEACLKRVDEREPVVRGFVSMNTEGARLLTADFRAGDLCLFGMFTLHGSVDNASPAGRVRLSVDTRWQAADQPMDERWAGPDPKGHGGKGYGALGSARPLGAPQLLR